MTMSEEKIKYLVEPDESKCIALRVRSTIVFAYPWCEEVGKHNPKVVTRTGEIVKHVQPAMKDGEKILTGELDGQRLSWDIDGRFEGDESKDLFVYERYWDKSWKSRIKMSHGEWEIKYGKRHPDVKIPDAWAEKSKRRLDDER